MSVEVTLRRAAALWKEGRAAQARAELAAALALDPTQRRLQRAAYAYSDVFTAPIAGRRITLVRRSAADLPMIRAAWADRAFMDRFHRFAAALPEDDAVLRATLDREAGATLLDSTSLHWSVVNADGERVGIVSLVDIALRHRRAELIVGIRGQSSFVTAEAYVLALELAFVTLKLRKLWCKVYDQNEETVGLLRHVGFTQEGLLRDHLRDPRSGTWISLAVLSLLQPEFEGGVAVKLARRWLGRPLLQIQ